MGRVKAKQVSVITKCTIDIRETTQTNQPFFESISNFATKCEDTLSLLTAILPPKFRGKTCTIDTTSNLVSWTPLSPNGGPGMLTLRKGTEEKTVAAYQKKIPLIEPFHWMKNKEHPIVPFQWQFQSASVLDPENQAYIDTLGSSLVSKLKTHYNSPHFCEFYGCFRGVIDTFKYNLEEDFEDMRFTSWFWEAFEKKEYNVHIIEKSTGRELSFDEIKETLKPDDEFLEDSDDEDSGSDLDSGSDSGSESESEESTPPIRKTFKKEESDDESVLSFVEIIEPSKDHSNNLEEADLDFEPLDSTVMVLNKKQVEGSVTSDETDTSFIDEFNIYVELPGMPAVVMYAETCQGTMDELLTQSDYAPVTTPEKEQIWSAWIFQVVAALCQLQGGLRLTHNDLHTNNVLWKETKEEFLWYKDSLDRVWKVPTYGRIFTIIDYGRAIFSINNFFCISSDYQDGRNAAGQYNFGPLEDPDEPKVMPNKSFDLCRLSCSLVRGLFPYNPEAKENPKVLTKERGWAMYETEHPLFNLLWSWLRGDNGANILETQDGSEKYPGFDMYIEIAKQVHGAVPNAQLAHPAMKGFMVKELPKGIKAITVPL